MPDDGIVCLDNGIDKLWFARYHGRAAELALARQRARHHGRRPAIRHRPRRSCTRAARCIAVCGDGGFLMNSQELETAVRLRLDLTAPAWCATTPTG